MEGSTTTTTTKNPYTMPDPDPASPSIRSLSPTILPLDEASTLRGMIQRQASTMVQFRKSEMTELTAVETTEESQKEEDDDSDSHSWHAAFELGSHHVWSDSDETLVPAASPGSDLHDSIEAIREEASRVDTAIALDQLYTLKNELESLRKQVSTRDSEIRHLRETITVKDTRLSTLQLERDLYKADVGCDATTSEPEEPAPFIPPWSPVSQLSQAGRSISADNSNKSHSKVSRVSSRRGVPPMRVTPIPPLLEEKVERLEPQETLLGPSSNTTALFRPVAMVPPSRSGALERTSKSTARHESVSVKSRQSGGLYKNDESTSETTDSMESLAFQLVPRPMSLHHHHKASMDQHHRHDKMEGPPRSIVSPQPLWNSTRKGRTKSHWSVPNGEEDVTYASTATRSRYRRGSMVAEPAATHGGSRSSKNGKSRSKTMEPPKDETNWADPGSKTCLLVPKLRSRRNKKKNPGSRERPKPDSVGSSYQTHTEELTLLLRTMQASEEELRKRLAMITTYYESVVQELLAKSDSAERDGPRNHAREHVLEFPTSFRATQWRTKEFQ